MTGTKKTDPPTNRYDYGTQSVECVRTTDSVRSPRTTMGTKTKWTYEEDVMLLRQVNTELPFKAKHGQPRHNCKYPRFFSLRHIMSSSKASSSFIFSKMLLDASVLITEAGGLMSRNLIYFLRICIHLSSVTDTGTDTDTELGFRNLTNIHISVVMQYSTFDSTGKCSTPSHHLSIY